MFDAKKKAALSKGDHSKKGTVDEEIRDLLDAINKKPYLYTTSSCAGRIVMIKTPKSGKKKDAEWLSVSHKLIDDKVYARMMRSLEKIPDEKVWLKMEPFILHVCTKDLETAEMLMDILRTVGLKHSGILSTRKRIIIEIVGNERMDVPIADRGDMLISDGYFRILIDEANKKLAASRNRMDMLKHAIDML